LRPTDVEKMNGWKRPTQTDHGCLAQTSTNVVITGTESLTDITRSGVGIVAMSHEWDSTDAADQLPEVDDLMDTWALTPAEDLFTFSCFAGST
jgi:hypothetical protein